MSETSKLLGDKAFSLLQHLYNEVNGVAGCPVLLNPAQSDALGITWTDLSHAKDDLLRSHFVEASPVVKGEFSIQLTEEGLEAVRRHNEVSETIAKLRDKATTLPPQMREEFESIVAEVRQKLQRQPHDRADLKVLIASLAEMFESHVPEITTLLRQIGL